MYFNKAHDYPVFLTAEEAYAFAAGTMHFQRAGFGHTAYTGITITHGHTDTTVHDKSTDTPVYRVCVIAGEIRMYAITR